MLSMDFKLVENNLSPTQRSRSQVKEKKAFFKRLERNLLVNAVFTVYRNTLQRSVYSSKYIRTPTIFSGNVVTVSLCSSSQGR